MCAKHSDLSKFTHAQLRQFSYDDLEHLSLHELAELAAVKLDIAEHSTQIDSHEISALLDALGPFLSLLTDQIENPEAKILVILVILLLQTVLRFS